VPDKPKLTTGRELETAVRHVLSCGDAAMHDRIKATTKQETERIVPTTWQNVQEPAERDREEVCKVKITRFYPAKSLRSLSNVLPVPDC
jgi:hypothetical protein